MDNIRWKGKSSLSYNGLIILSLPPISSPPINTRETVVEGKDGSIIELLGYKAYDKSIKIGLKGDAVSNINDIIEYFSGSGELVMSNEPDKVYQATIISQIDFDKLLRFRTAEVKFRVQPFKLLDGESEVSVASGDAVINSGNVESKPLITIEGSGIVEVAVNGVNQFSYEFPADDSKVVIDCEKEDAYLDTALKNRYMTGEFPKLKAGSNTITFSGSVTSFKIVRKSRWI